MFVFRCRRSRGRNHVNTPRAEEVSLSRNLCRRGWRLTAGSRPQMSRELDTLTRNTITRKNNACRLAADGRDAARRPAFPPGIKAGVACGSR